MEGATAQVEPAFVGRVHEIEQLSAGLAEAAVGRGRLFLLSGEAGIGKTRLADELASRASATGTRVLWGRCWESGGAPAYWPWVQILRGYARDTPAATVAEQMAHGAADLAHLLPELGAARADAAPREAESEQARFSLFDSTATFLRNAAGAQPLLLVLDDLHAADESSLLLLQFLARDLRSAPLLVIGTYRESDARRVPARLEILSALVREGPRLPLRGLSQEEVGRYIAAAARAGAHDTLVNAIHHATDGNPFFVTEVVRLWLAAGARPSADGEFEIPDEVRAAVRRRVDPLSAPAREALAIASVIGREFDAAVFERVAETADARERLAEAVDAGLVAAAGVGRYAFAHALVRQTVYGDLPPSRRVALHLAVAEALEAYRHDDIEPHLADLAHHFFQAAPGGGAERAAEYARRAGDQALAQLAYAEAAAHYERALHALDLRKGDVGDGPGDALARGALLIAFGRAQSRSGGAATWRASFRRAASIARALLDGPQRPAAAQLLADAALGLGRKSETGAVDQALVTALQEALAVVGDADRATRALLLARLSMALYFSDTPARGEALSREAVDLARRLGNPTVLLHCLIARQFALWRPDTLAERTAIASEIVELGAAAGERELALEGRLWRIAAALEAADVDGAAADIDAFTRAAALLRHPLYQWHAMLHRGMRALADGRLDDANEITVKARDAGLRSGLENPLQAFAIQTFWTRRERLELADIAAEMQAVGERFPLPIWRCGAALLAAETGRANEAQEMLTAMAARDCAAIPVDGNWLPAMAILAETSVALDDRPFAAWLRARLEPFAQRFVVVAQAIACLGPVTYFLGLLAGLAGDWDDAIAHLGAALDSAERLDAGLLVSQCQCALAAALVAAAPQAPPESARELATAALGRAEERGLARVAAHARRVLDRLGSRLEPAPAPTPSPPSASRMAAAIFRKDGHYWTVMFDGVESRLKDARGLVYLAQLLRHPDQELHSLDLATSFGRPGDGPRGGAAAADLRVESGDAGALLDAAAKQAYRRRLDDLREELEEATEFNDPGRAERAQVEIEAISRELAAAVGLGQRDRKTGSAAERSRVAVTKAISLALKAIAETNPSLHRYLSGTIKTGQFCSFTPDPRFTVKWELG